VLTGASAEERKWLFLPRKASEHTPYDERTDEFLASNLLLIADEDFSHVEVRNQHTHIATSFSRTCTDRLTPCLVQVRRVGPLECDYGFTSMKVIPHTNEIIALKVRVSSFAPIVAVLVSSTARCSPVDVWRARRCGR
jgi:hypothetical protein